MTVRTGAPRPGPAMLKRVLIVDDEPGVRRTLSRLLERAGYEVHTADGAEDAIGVLGAADFALVVTDLHLPGESGLDLLTQIRSRAPDTRLILMSGRVDVPSAAIAVDRGIDALITKPFDLEDFRERVDAAALRYHTSRAAHQDREMLEARLRQRDTESKLWILRAAHALAQAVEAKDPYTAGHGHRVTAYAMGMAELAGGIDLERFRLAGALHDVGKIGVPDAVLNKPGRLDTSELALIRRHPVVGRGILAPLIDDPMILGVVHWHHERWDGGGYPEGRSGLDVPLPARILAVADTLDAMTSSRSYRSAVPWADTVNEIRRSAGTQFDPQVVELFEGVLPDLEQKYLRFQDRTTIPGSAA